MNAFKGLTFLRDIMPRTLIGSKDLLDRDIPVSMKRGIRAETNDCAIALAQRRRQPDLVERERSSKVALPKTEFSAVSQRIIRTGPSLEEPLPEYGHCGARTRKN